MKVKENEKIESPTNFSHGLVLILCRRFEIRASSVRVKNYLVKTKINPVLFIQKYKTKGVRKKV